MDAFGVRGANRVERVRAAVRALQKRVSLHGAERRFVESRLDRARRELRAAEDALQAFLQSNRQFSNSPELNSTASAFSGGFSCGRIS